MTHDESVNTTDTPVAEPVADPGTTTPPETDADSGAANTDPALGDPASGEGGDAADEDADHELDAGRLFQISRQIDRLRDDCRWLLRRYADPIEVLAAATERYDHLIASLDALLSDDQRQALAADMGERRPESLAELMVASGQLAAWVDGLLLGPAFLVTHHAQSFNSSMLDAIRRGAGPTDLEGPVSPTPPGAYL